MRVSAERRLYLRVDLGIAVPPARRCEPTVPLPHQVKTLPPDTGTMWHRASRYGTLCVAKSLPAEPSVYAWQRHRVRGEDTGVDYL